MFRKTKNRIVLAIIGALLLMLLTTLAVIYTSSSRDLRRQSEEMLARYAELYSLETLPEDAPPAIPPVDGSLPGRETPAFQLSTFYSAAFSDTGELLALDDGKTGLYTTEEIETLARELVAQGKRSGHAGTLLYLLTPKDGYTLIAFKDDTVNDASLHTLLRHTLMGGGIAIVLIVAVSMLLAERIVKPLEENDLRQRQFVSDAGHELKTPVAVIETNAELLARQAGENEWLSNIRYETGRMGDLVTRLLDLSRAENAETPKEPLDLSRLVLGETLPFESVAFERGLRIETEISQEVNVEGNAPQLKQLVSILLDNAIRHSEGGDTVKLSLREDRRSAVLAVSNKGGPIAPEQQERLFDRFYRLDESRSGGQSYGLGLAIAKAIAQAHRGSIGVESADGHVTFTVTIPTK